MTNLDSIKTNEDLVMEYQHLYKIYTDIKQNQTNQFKIQKAKQELDDKAIAICERYKNFIYKEIHKHYKTYINSYFDDMVALAKVEILSAAKTFKNNGTRKFSTYAYSYIIGGIREVIQKSHGVTNYTFTMIKKIENAENELKNEGYDNVDPVDLARKLKVGVNAILNARLSGGAINQTSIEFKNSINDSFNPQLVSENKECKEILDDIITNVLTTDEKNVILHLYYDDKFKRKYTIALIAKEMSVSGATVKKLEQSAIRKFRNDERLRDIVSHIECDKYKIFKKEKISFMLTEDEVEDLLNCAMEADLEDKTSGLNIIESEMPISC